MPMYSVHFAYFQDIYNLLILFAIYLIQIGMLVGLCVCAYTVGLVINFT